MTSARIHHSKPGSPHERGLDFGYGNAELVAGTVATYRRLFGATRGIDDAGVRAAGAEIRERVGRDWPALADEIAAIAHGSGVDEAELFAVNARTELLAGQLRGECSTLALRNPGQPALMQNWDWHPDLAPSRIVWIVDQGEGRWFATFTEAGILAKIGLNSRGLAVCLNLLATDADGGLDGLPLHLALRLILETCEDAEDVRQLLADAPMGGSSCITVMTPGGEPAIFECHPGGPPLEPAVGREWAAHTNHFLGALPSGLIDTLRRDWPDTDARLARATAALSESSAEDDAVAVLRDHADGPISVCCHDGGNPEFVERQQTLAR